MTTSTNQIQERSMPNIIEQKIFKSMSELLRRVGLDYRGGYVEVDGKRIHYLDYGEGAPVLLLHGGGSGSAIWFRQIEVLARTRRVIVPDHPVFGLSSQTVYKPPYPDCVVDYMTGLMDVLDIQTADLVGLSLGAQMAMATAMQIPERVGKIAAIGAAGLGKEFPLLYKLAGVPIAGRLIVRPNKWGQDTYFKTMEVVDYEFQDAIAYKQYAYDVTLMEGHPEAMRSSIGTIADFGGQKSIFSDEELRSIESPVLAIWGDGDQVFPVGHAYRLAEVVPNARLHVIENARHVPLLDHPVEVNKLLVGFLSSD